MCRWCHTSWSRTVVVLLVGALTVAGGVIGRNRISVRRDVSRMSAAGSRSSHDEIVLPPSDQPLILQATGRDFFWDFRFAGADGVFGTEDDRCVRRDVHLPQHCSVELRVTSDDYVYTFSVPALNLRRIAVPELTYTVTFRTSQSGRFPAVVDAMCSVRLFHRGPMGNVVIESREAFDQWYHTHTRGDCP